jgi:hypothetical protein
MSIQKDVNIFENSKIIHIASEIFVLCGFTFYVVYQNKKLSARIDDLLQKIEEKEERLLKIENFMQQLTTVIPQINQKLQMHDNQFNLLTELVNETKNHDSDVTTKSKKSTTSKIRSDKETHVKPILKNEKPASRVSKIQFKNPIVEKTKPSIDIEELSDSDLDSEITQELAELEEDDNDSSLKKEA